MQPSKDARPQTAADILQFIESNPQTDPILIPLPSDIDCEELFEAACDVSAREQTLLQELEDTKATLAVLQQEHESTKELLRLRSDELRGAQAFIVTADKMSLSDVQRAVQQLNAEIFQLATLIADKWTYRANYQARSGDRADVERNAWDQLKTIIGGRMLGLLRSVRHEESSYCVQIALQSCLAAHSARACEYWATGGEGKGASYIRGVYDRLKGSESPSVSRMWRALACRYGEQTRKSKDSDEVSGIAGHLANVLIVSGVAERLEKVHAAILSSFSSSLEKIIGHIVGLQRILYGSITSCELRLAFAHPDDRFEDSRHEDIGGDESSEQQGSEVLCTIDLGLVRIEEHDGTITMLKPKVCTDTIISILMEHGVKDGKFSSSRGGPRRRGHRDGGRSSHHRRRDT